MCVMDSLRFAVRVKPGASRLRVGGSFGDPPALVVAGHEQPVDGQANAAVIQALASAFNARRADFQVISGHKSRTKVIEFTAESVASASAMLEQLLKA